MAILGHVNIALETCNLDCKITLTLTQFVMYCMKVRSLGFLRIYLPTQISSCSCAVCHSSKNLEEGTVVPL